MSDEIQGGVAGNDSAGTSTEAAKNERMSEPSPLVSLVIPVYNEADHLERFLEVIDAVKLPAEKELIFIDDCSRDGSREILQAYKFKSKVQILLQPQNCGKGAAIRRGLQAAVGTVIGVQDADFEYEPSDIPTLVTPLLEGKAEAVFGSRFSRGGNQVHRTLHYLVNLLLTTMSNLLSGLYLSDMETCYKFFRADVIKNVMLESDRFGFEPEVTAKVARLKLRVMEFPISYFPRNYIEGKKITWRDGIAALRHIVYFNLFVPQEKCFTKDLPNRFIPRGGNWL